jgi:hypothetical protein
LVLTRGADQVTLTNYFLGDTAIVEQITAMLMAVKVPSSQPG